MGDLPCRWSYSFGYGMGLLRPRVLQHTSLVYWLELSLELTHVVSKMYPNADNLSACQKNGNRMFGHCRPLV
jgi:hypothetical protein